MNNRKRKKPASKPKNCYLITAGQTAQVSTKVEVGNDKDIVRGRGLYCLKNGTLKCIETAILVSKIDSGKVYGKAATKSAYDDRCKEQNSQLKEHPGTPFALGALSYHKTKEEAEIQKNILQNDVRKYYDKHLYPPVSVEELNRFLSTQRQTISSLTLQFSDAKTDDEAVKICEAMFDQLAKSQLAMQSQVLFVPEDKVKKQKPQSEVKRFTYLSVDHEELLEIPDDGNLIVKKGYGVYVNVRGGLRHRESQILKNTKSEQILGKIMVRGTYNQEIKRFESELIGNPLKTQTFRAFAYFQTKEEAEDLCSRMQPNVKLFFKYYIRPPKNLAELNLFLMYLQGEYLLRYGEYYTNSFQANALIDLLKKPVPAAPTVTIPTPISLAPQTAIEPTVPLISTVIVTPPLASESQTSLESSDISTLTEETKVDVFNGGKNETQKTYDLYNTLWSTEFNDKSKKEGTDLVTDFLVDDQESVIDKPKSPLGKLSIFSSDVENTSNVSNPTHSSKPVTRFDHE